MSDVFLSYRKLPDRRALVERLAAILEAHGLSVWWDFGLEAGEHYRERIFEELDAARIVTPLWCQHSVGSEWVLREARHGRGKLLPARIQAVHPPAEFEAIQAADLSLWDGRVEHDALKRLVDRIGATARIRVKPSSSLVSQLKLLPLLSPLTTDGRQEPEPRPAALVWLELGAEPSVNDLRHFADAFPGTREAFDARRMIERLENERTAFDQAKKANTRDALATFILSHPQARQVPMANDLLLQLAAAALARAKSARSETLLLGVARDFPNSPHAMEALRSVESSRRDAELASAAQSQAPRAAVTDFIHQHPTSDQADRARALLDTLPPDLPLIKTEAKGGGTTSPDGMRIIVLDETNTYVLDARSGAEVVKLPVQNGEFVSNGERLVGEAGDEAAVFDCATGAKTASLGKAIRAFGSRHHLALLASFEAVRVADTLQGRDVAVLRGHRFPSEGAIRSVDFSADGKRLVTGSIYNEARLWDIPKARELAVVRGKVDFWLPHFSCDGSRLIVSSGDSTVQLLDGGSGKPIAVLQGHASFLLSATFSQDGSRIVTASNDCTANIWRSSTGQHLGTLRGHTAGLWKARFCPNGKTIATASKDKTVRIWDALNGRELARCEGHESDVRHVSFSPCGTYIASCATDDVCARIWQTSTGKLVGLLSGGRKPVHTVQFVAQGARVMTESGDGICVWDATALR